MQLYLLVNEKCNLKCEFCIRGAGHDGQLDLNEFEKILRRNNFSKYVLMISGGEPSLYYALPELIDICIGKFKKVCINTNGVNSEWIDRLRTTDIHVQISVDGSKAFHEELRGVPGIFEKIKDTISKLNAAGISYNISTTVGKDNIGNVDELLSEIKTYENVKYWKISLLLPFGCAKESDTISINEWNRFVDYVLDNAGVVVKIKKLFEFDLLDQYINSGKIKDIHITSNCGDVKSKIYVYPDFTVYPCTCLTDFPVGNLLENNLEEIVNSDASEKFVHYSVSENSSCKTCKYLKYCNGGCIGMSYHHFGELGRGDYRCPMVK
ncbi:MAG: radical SAM protein [Roseburia sp.]